MPKNLDCLILCNQDLDDSLADELFAKVLQSFETCLSVNNNFEEN